MKICHSSRKKKTKTKKQKTDKEVTTGSRRACKGGRKPWVRLVRNASSQMCVKHLAKWAHSVSPGGLSFRFLATLERAHTHLCMPHCLGQDTSASDPAYPLNCNNLQGQLQSDCRHSLCKRGWEPHPSRVTEGWSWNREFGSIKQLSHWEARQPCVTKPSSWTKPEPTGHP